MVERARGEAATERDDVLLVDDDTLVLRAFEATLKRSFNVHCVTSGATAIEFLANRPDIAVVIIDQRMPGMSGPELIRHLTASHPNLVRIIVTGYQDINSLSQAINNGGAYRYLEKPCRNEELLEAVHNATELHHRLVEHSREPAALQAANAELATANQLLELENLQLRRASDEPFAFARRIVGSSPALQRVLAEADRMAATDTTVLISGETGTGKELLARYLHERGARRARTFRAQNCGAVGDQLMEDMLFGHVAGAFTGARNPKKGLFEVATGGSLFLDEIGECSPSLQARLLRVVEEKVLHRLGDDEHAIHVDVRLIAATNRDLRSEVTAGRFREDLYYRLNVFNLSMPPLRDRRSDIREIAAYFVSCCNEKARHLSGKSIAGITPEAIRALEGYDYPGNIRELANIIERAWLYCDDGDSVSTEHILPSLGAATPTSDSLAPCPPSPAGGTLRLALAQFKTEHIRNALANNAWNVAATARQLGITRGRLYEEIKESGLQRPN